MSSAQFKIQTRPKSVSSHLSFESSHPFAVVQIWRLYTSFFLANGGITFIFELVILDRMMDQLESGPHGPYARRSADLAWQLFVANILVLGSLHSTM
ncbi:hypothetical protein B0H13DRAFT_2343858 [Mycena leptocephala]|nr:hypothetical protein B0H13DRAFT_2343858 [Mycena leptocephala]